MNINQEYANECERRLVKFSREAPSNYDLIALLVVFHERLIELERKK